MPAALRRFPPHLASRRSHPYRLHRLSPTLPPMPYTSPDFATFTAVFTDFASIDEPAFNYWLARAVRVGQRQHA